jgi:hypothetical protein
MLHKDILHNRQQVLVLILVFLQITHITATAAATAFAAEGSREAASLYHSPLHLAEAKKTDNSQRG